VVQKKEPKWNCDFWGAYTNFGRAARKLRLFPAGASDSNNDIPLDAIIVYYLPCTAFIGYLFSKIPIGLNFFKIPPAGMPAGTRGLPGNAIRIVGTSGILL
jgi:hypothetical protein